MNNQEKLTYDCIIQQLLDGKIDTGLPEYLRRSWIRYCYHYSAVENVVSILKRGELYSRNKSRKLGIMTNDNASNDVISNTKEWVKDYVRFYFRPKTPTQFHNEGFRSEATMTPYQAHCPFPVFLLFDFKSVLDLKNCYFTNHSLAKSDQQKMLNTPKEFWDLPFKKIYHVGYFPSECRDEIVSSRQAEIIVYDKVKIAGLIKKILVRSPAERQTLFALLGENVSQKYSDLIQIDSKKSVFYGRWVFIENVVLSSKNVSIEFNCGEQSTVFSLKVCIKDCTNNLVKQYCTDNWLCLPKHQVHWDKPINKYEIKIFLNESLAFYDKYNQEENTDLPF